MKFIYVGLRRVESVKNAANPPFLEYLTQCFPNAFARGHLLASKNNQNPHILADVSI